METIIVISDTTRTTGGRSGTSCEPRNGEQTLVREWATVTQTTKVSRDDIGTSSPASCLDQNLTLAHWRHVIFADESRFLLYMQDGRLRVRRQRGEVLNEECMAETVAFGGGSVHVWGAFCISGTAPLVILDRNVNGLVYRDILRNTLLPYARGVYGHNFRYQDDNARPHRARVVTDFIAQEGVICMDQPPRSPDVNPIEHLWSDMSRELLTMDNPPQTLPQLRQALLDIWQNITVPRMQKLVESMPRRVQAVIDARGGPTRY